MRLKRALGALALAALLAGCQPGETVRPPAATGEKRTVT